MRGRPQAPAVLARRLDARVEPMQATHPNRLAFALCAFFALTSVQCAQGQPPPGAGVATPTSGDVDSLRKQKEDLDRQQREAERKLHTAELEKELAEETAQRDKALAGQDRPGADAHARRIARLKTTMAWKQRHWALEDEAEAARAGGDEKKAAELDAKLEQSSIQHEIDDLQAELDEALAKVAELQRQIRELKAKQKP